MRSLFLLTKTPIRYSDVLSLFMERFSGVEGCSEHDQISFGKSPNSLFLHLDESKLHNEGEDWDDYPEEFIQTIPMDNPFCAHVEYHLSKISKRVVELLSPFYPELYVIVEDSQLWAGPAKEYLSKDFDY